MASFYKILTVTLIAVPITYLSSCSYITWAREEGYRQVETGNAEAEVIKNLGEPSRRTIAGEVFLRYEGTGCSAPCAVRMWYENRMEFDIEVWTIDLDSSGSVLGKYKFVLP